MSQCFPWFSKIKPIATPDPIIMVAAISMLDKMLALLTQDNDAQIKWLKQFIALDSLQHPAIKAQVCPIIIGGQGIGKSLVWRYSDARPGLAAWLAWPTPALSPITSLFITPFVGKLITFVDEVRLESPSCDQRHQEAGQAGQCLWPNEIRASERLLHSLYLLIASNQVDIGAHTS